MSFDAPIIEKTGHFGLFFAFPCLNSSHNISYMIPTHYTRTSPDNSFGSNVSRKAASVRDSVLLAYALV